MNDNLDRGRKLFFAIFTISGFSGLIYESIWSHYLKLFLGHAAYAQTLVLAIFMGGMAVGSWLMAKYSTRVRNLLIGYAIVEGVIGLFGVMAYLVSQRTREIGVRLALGATRATVFRTVIGGGIALAAAGAAIGVIVAAWLTRLMANLLFSVSPRDPVIFTAVPVAMVMVAAFACYLPARRATQVDPMIALRERMGS